MQTALPIPPPIGEAPPSTIEEAQPTWGVIDMIMALVLYVALAFVTVLAVRLPFQLHWVPPGMPKTELSAALAGFVELLMLVPVWLFAIVWRRSSWRTVGFRRFRPALGCLLPVAYLCGAFTLSAMWGIVIRIMNWPTQTGVDEMFGSGPAGIAIGFVAVAIAAPIAEETFFRGFILGGLQRRLGTIGALIVSAAIFTAPHLPVTIYPAIFALGLLLGLLFIQTKSLWPGILLHAMFNTISFSAQMYCALNSCKGL
ncbi:MAG: CPBP family intramembrane metalloprotease [Chloroflexi bacterium]|nr:CPBP family intramembrane metalloprotease [Chloroflexota bacterium]